MHYPVVVVVMVMAVLVGGALALVPQACSGGSTCFYPNVAKLQPAASGANFAVGGIFDIHHSGSDGYSCGSMFKPKGIILSQAFLWALNHWQKEIGGSVSIGGVVFDACCNTDNTIQLLMGFGQCNLRIQDIDRHALVGYVGTTNENSDAAVRVAASMELPVVSPLADRVAMDNPYFFSTTPSLQVDVNILTLLLRNIGTRYVSVIYEESQMATLRAFEMSMASANICVVASIKMDASLSNASLDHFLVGQKKTHYVATFLTDPALTQRLIDNGNLTSLNLVFLVPSSVKPDSPFFHNSNTRKTENAIYLQWESPAAVASAVSEFEKYWDDVINFRHNNLSSRINNPFLTAFLNETKDVSQVPRYDPALASTIMATRALVRGVYLEGREICSNSNNYLCTTFFNRDGRGVRIRARISSGTDYFTPAGALKDTFFTYSISRRMVGGNFQKLGSYENGQLRLNVLLQALGPYYAGSCPNPPCRQCGEMPTTTPAPTTTTTQATCEPEDQGGNLSSVLYPRDQEITGAYMLTSRDEANYDTRFDIGQKWIIALGVLGGLGMLAVLIFEIYILYKLLGTRMGHKWRTMWLGQLLLVGIFLCYLTLFAYLPVPTKATCGITRFGVGVSYSICFAVLLVKLMVILTSKTSENSLLPGDVESPNYLKGVYQFLMFVFVVGVQVVIDAQWLITVPPEAVKVKAIHGGEVWICNHYTFKASGSMTDMAGFVRSEFENHVMSLIYIMFLILITTLLALNAHGIITNHRESVFIGIASGFSIPVWLAWTLVGGLNKDHDYAHEFGDACIAFGLFLTATLLLFAMFLPKVRQLVSMGVEGIYFEDDRDTVYAGSVIMAPPSYKSRPNSVIYVNNQGIYSEPVVVGNGDSTYLRHGGSSAIPTNTSTYSAPPYLKRGGNSTLRGGSVLQVTDDLSGRRPLEKKRPMSEVAYATGTHPRSVRGTLPRSRSHNNLGAL